MTKIEIGFVTKPQGLKGEFRIKPSENVFKILSSLSKLEINGKQLSVVKVTNKIGYFIFKVKELTTIDEVEVLRNKPVFAFVSETDAKQFQNFAGYKVLSNGKEVGVVEEVKNFGATDVYFLTNGKSFPLVPNLVLNVFDEKEEIVVDSKILEEVILWK